jgi:hypothetical protein
LPHSQDRSFDVLGQNRSFVVAMAVGSIVGSFIGGRLLNLIAAVVLLPLLALKFAWSLSGTRFLGARGLPTA